MLILDKQKAVEHMVALMAHSAGAAAPEERPAHSRARRRQKVAQFERLGSAIEDAPAPRRSRARTRASLHPAGGGTPA
jgi:hypothetical protein